MTYISPTVNYTSPMEHLGEKRTNFATESPDQASVRMPLSHVHVLLPVEPRRTASPKVKHPPRGKTTRDHLRGNHSSDPQQPKTRSRFNGSHHLGVSKNRGTPKWMVYKGNPIKMDDLGVPIFFGNTHFLSRLFWGAPTVLSFSIASAFFKSVFGGSCSKEMMETMEETTVSSKSFQSPALLLFKINKRCWHFPRWIP